MLDNSHLMSASQSNSRTSSSLGETGGSPSRNFRSPAEPGAQGLSRDQQLNQGPTDSLFKTICQFGALFALGTAWYVKPVRGPLAAPLDLREAPHELACRALLLRSPQLADNCSRLREKPFRLVLGAGFVGGLYRHLGLLRAFADAGIKPDSMAGVSAGAIVGAMAGAMPLRGENSVEAALMSLQPQDFLDPSWETLRNDGAICSGKALVRKLERIFAPSGKQNLEETKPQVSVEIYDTHTGVTSLLTKGSIVRAVRWSASLPVLFAGDRYIDGGWVDQNGLLAMTPGQRAVNHRIFEGNGARTFMEWRVSRPPVILSPSQDPEHRTLHFVGPEKITEANFVFALQDKAKLERITSWSETAVKTWLAQPAER